MSRPAPDPSGARNAGWSVTGIGSLGETDPDAAVRAVLEWGLDVPFWPQLPRRASTEGMVQQAALPLGCVRPVDARATLWCRVEGREGARWRAAVRAGRAAAAGGRGPDAERAAGFIAFERALAGRRSPHVKGQWIGPATLAASLVLDSGTCALEDPELLSALLDMLHLQVLDQARRLLDCAEAVDLWLDEPLVTSVAVARADFSALARWYATLGEACGPRVRLGVHCCAPPPWDALFALGVPLVALDTWSFAADLVACRAALRAQLERGAIAWGVVPARGQAPDLEEVLDRFAAVRQAVAPSGAAAGLARRSLLTPACGLAGLDAQAARARLGLAGACAAQLRRAA